ncbi:PucR family transcriptional regulator [Nocardiopsis sp. LOL_012]|uniref:PucR family transcriptional regulator n=1 Tax=Nocardiopsis sp. LOL_012 TaxID=3345409 RepID=UPI003A8748E6
MVQSAVSEEPWPRVSPRVAELMRRGAESVLAPRQEWVDQIVAASLRGERMRPITEDPVLAEGVRRTNRSNLLHWAAANVREPGCRVPANLAPETVEAARDLVRRGLDQNALGGYRTAQGVVWRRWTEICFGLTSDPDELRELLDVSALSISTFIDDTVAAISARMESERAELTRGTHAERRETVALLLEGAPIGRARAEARLGYRLTGPHTAAIVWGGSATAPERLGEVAEALANATGAAGRLTVVAGAASLWMWLPVATVPETGPLAERLADRTGVRVALGRPGPGVDGFRRSHLDAAATQRMLARSPRRIARYEDVQLAALLTADTAQAEEFVADTLGDLVTADPQVREAVEVYVRERCSTTAAARRLYTHRNTVLRRLARADELLPRPLADNVVAVAAALEVLRWRGEA